MFVEEKSWMTAEEFNDVYALCQFLPGPNIVNLTAVFGSRMRGATGALAAWAGFLVLPFTLMVTVGVLYAQYGDVDALRRVLTGIAAAAAGLLIATAAKMVVPLFKRGVRPAPFVVLATALAIGVMRWPLFWVLAVARARQYCAGLVGAAMKDDGDVLLRSGGSVRASCRCWRSAAPMRWCRRSIARRSICAAG